MVDYKKPCAGCCCINISEQPPLKLCTQDQEVEARDCEFAPANNNSPSEREESVQTINPLQAASSKTQNSAKPPLETKIWL